jgi:hypothetical protein
MMMKKLLILMLVLGITSVANAAFTLVVDGADVGDAMILVNGGLINIGVHNDTPGDTSDTQQLLSYLIIHNVAAGEWTGVHNVYIPPAVTGSTATDLGVGDHLGTGEMIDVFIGDFSEPGLYFSGVGVLGDFQYKCNSDIEVAFVELMNGTTGAIEDTLTITQIPEPMTIALLGLGGLFMLRRRK